MDSLEARQAILYQDFKPADSVIVTQLKSRPKSPEQDKKVLMEKIKTCMAAKAELEAKQQSLYLTISDLKTVLHNVSCENEEGINRIEEQNAKLAEKAVRLSAALKYAHKNGKHLQNCALYWREFVQ